MIKPDFALSSFLIQNLLAANGVACQQGSFSTEVMLGSHWLPCMQSSAGTIFSCPSHTPGFAGSATQIRNSKYARHRGSSTKTQWSPGSSSSWRDSSNLKRGCTAWKEICKESRNPNLEQDSKTKVGAAETWWWEKGKLQKMQGCGFSFFIAPSSCCKQGNFVNRK